MASSEQRCIVFFVMACCFGMLVGLIGCATNNWSKPIFNDSRTIQNNVSEQPLTSKQRRSPESGEDLPERLGLRAQWQSFWNTGFGSKAGIDPRAREIEKSLGY